MPSFLFYYQFQYCVYTNDITIMHAHFTAERHRLIVEHLALRNPEHVIVNDVIQTGVPEEEVKGLIKHVLQMQEQAKAMKPSSFINPQFRAQAVVKKVPVPEPIKEGYPSVIDLGDIKVRVNIQLEHPRLVVFENVLTEAECDGLIDLAIPTIGRSTVVNNSDGTSVVHSARTSSGAYFHKAQHELIDKIDQRLAKLTNWDYDKGEGLQILRYEPGQEYVAHHDWFDPNSPGASTVIGNSGNRVGTIILYLNDVEEGGSTNFPETGLHVMPKKGSAVFFSYDCPSPESKTLHAGSPVVKGVKWIATKWLRESTF